MIRILHVDDNPDDFELTKRKLQRLSDDVKVEWAESGSLALKALEEGTYSIVICDFQMPEMDGLGFIQTLRERGDQTPIIFFSGQGNEEVTMKALRAGAVEYFIKDTRYFRYERLMRTIRKVVKEYPDNGSSNQILVDSNKNNRKSSSHSNVVPLGSKP